MTELKNKISSPIYKEEGRVAHRNFLSSCIIFLEDRELSVIDSAPDRVVVTPLLIENGDAAPATSYAIYS